MPDGRMQFPPADTDPINVFHEVLIDDEERADLVAKRAGVRDHASINIPNLLSINDYEHAKSSPSPSLVVGVLAYPCTIGTGKSVPRLPLVYCTLTDRASGTLEDLPC